MRWRERLAVGVSFDHSEVVEVDVEPRGWPHEPVVEADVGCLRVRGPVLSNFNPAIVGLPLETGIRTRVTERLAAALI